MAKFCRKLRDQLVGLGQQYLATKYQQFLIVGLENVGKTTLLYRLKFGDEWRDMKKDLAEMKDAKNIDHPNLYDAGYHYEEFTFLSMCGIWDLPGAEPMRHFWHVVYANVEIHGVFFVVDGRDMELSGTAQDIASGDQDIEAAKRIQTAKREFHTMLHEDALRRSFFFVIVNHRSQRAKSTSSMGDKANQYIGSKAEVENIRQFWTMALGVGEEELPQTVVDQVKLFILDCDKINGEYDPEWVKICDAAKQVLADEEKSFGFNSI